MTVTVPGNPVPWQRAGMKGRQIFTAPRTRAHETLIKACAIKAGWKPLAGPIALTVAFYRENLIRCDLDNLVKAVKDALNGVAWEDDSQVIALEATKAVDPEEPRTVIRVETKPVGEEPKP